MELGIPGLLDIKPNSAIEPLQKRNDDFFDNSFDEHTPKQLTGSEDVVSQSYKARSSQIKGEKNEFYEVDKVLEYRKKKGKKGFEYKIQWKNHEPTWEGEITLKDDIPTLIDSFKKKAPSTESKETIASSQLTVTKQPLKSSSPQKSNQYAQDTNFQNNNQVQQYEDLDTVFIQNLGNWKKLKRQDNKDIYKCAQCEAKLEIEKKGQQCKVKNLSFGQAHNWFDQAHIQGYLENQEKLHTSVQSYVKHQIKITKVYDAELLLENLKKDKPQLFKYFQPTEEQITFQIFSMNKDFHSPQKAQPPKEEQTRKTRSGKQSAPPIPSHPEAVESILKKREVKEKVKKQEKDQKTQKQITEVPIVEQVVQQPEAEPEKYSQEIEIKLDEPQPKPISEQTPPSSAEKSKPKAEKKPKKAPKRKLNTPEKKQKSDEKLPTDQATPTTEEQHPPSENISNKRVKFNAIVEQAEFEKMSSEEEDEDENSDMNVFSESGENDEDESMGDCDSDQEDLESGRFIEMVKRETNKANKERNYLIKQLKARERRGSIFIDKINKVVAAVQRESGKYDYLIEWKYNKQDKLTPSTSIVKGGYFVFANPLLYRRFVEQNYIDHKNAKQRTIYKKEEDEE